MKRRSGCADLWKLTAVAQPNLAQPVLVHCRQDCGQIPLER